MFGLLLHCFPNNNIKFTRTYRHRTQEEASDQDRVVYYVRNHTESARERGEREGRREGEGEREEGGRERGT